jgi:Fungal protein kinase
MSMSHLQGTLPFVSYRILKILQKNIDADATGRQQKQIIDHQPADDLESLFYVLVWICILYDGPNNSPRTDVSFQHTPVYQWAEQDFARGDFSMCLLSKFKLMTSHDTTALTNHITPYFKCLEPFLLEWRNKIGMAFDKDDEVPPMQHADVLEILNKALTHIRTSNTTHTSPATIDSSDDNAAPLDMQDAIFPPQAVQKRAKRSIPPSDRQLRPRHTGVSLGETLAKRVPLKRRSGEAGIKSSSRKRSAG